MGQCLKCGHVAPKESYYYDRDAFENLKRGYSATKKYDKYWNKARFSSPLDLYAHIATFLPLKSILHLRAVSKQWNQYVSSKKAWDCVRLDVKIPDNLSRYRYLQFIRKLSVTIIQTTFPIDQKQFDHLLGLFPYLVDLELDSKSISLEMISVISTLAPKLKSLKLFGDFKQPVIHLGSLSRLEYLFIEVDLDYLQHRHLSNQSIERLFFLESIACNVLSDGNLTALHRAKNGCLNDGSSINISWKPLSKLDAFGSEVLTDRALSSLNFFQYLTFLNVSGTCIHMESFLENVHGLPRLKHFILPDNVNALQLHVVSIKWPLLETLGFFTQELRNDQEYVPLLTLQKLEHLEMNHHKAACTLKTLFALLKHPTLKELVLSGCGCGTCQLFANRKLTEASKFILINELQPRS